MATQGEKWSGQNRSNRTTGIVISWTPLPRPTTTTISILLDLLSVHVYSLQVTMLVLMKTSLPAGLGERGRLWPSWNRSTRCMYMCSTTNFTFNQLALSSPHNLQCCYDWWWSNWYGSLSSCCEYWLSLSQSMLTILLFPSHCHYSHDLRLFYHLDHKSAPFPRISYTTMYLGLLAMNSNYMFSSSWHLDLLTSVLINIYDCANVDVSAWLLDNAHQTMLHNLPQKMCNYSASMMGTTMCMYFSMDMCPRLHACHIWVGGWWGVSNISLLVSVVVNNSVFFSMASHIYFSFNLGFLLQFFFSRNNG